MEYVDLTTPEAQAGFPDLLAIIEERNLPYPLVAVNGQVQLAGTAQYMRIVPLVDEALEESKASVPA